MILYTYPGSPICRPIAMFAADHEVDVEQKVVDPLAENNSSPPLQPSTPIARYRFLTTARSV